MDADRHALTTRWDDAQLLVTQCGRSDQRIAAADIRRAILVCDEAGDAPEHLAFALIDCGGEHLLLPAASGIAHCVYFERQAWWTQRACIYWVTRPHAALPRRLVAAGSRITLLRPDRPPFLRLDASQLVDTVAHWPLEGPQTWEQRRWAQQARTRRFQKAHRLPSA